MSFCRVATKAALLAAVSTTSLTALADGNAGCATLVGAPSGSNSPQGFQIRNGEPVDLVSGAKVVHGKLLVFSDEAVFRAYWQPDDSPKKIRAGECGRKCRAPRVDVAARDAGQKRRTRYGRCAATRVVVPRALNR